MTANLLSLTSSWPAERHLAGMCTGAAAWTIAQRIDGPTLVVAPSTAVATQLVEDIGFHLGTGHLVHRLPGDDVRPYEGLSPHPSVIRARIDATARLHRDEPCVVVTDPAGLSLRLLSKDALADLTLSLRVGEVLDKQALATTLVQHGYHAVPKVIEAGTMSNRGDTIEIWPISRPHPVRILFFDDEIEDIRSPDPAGQSAVETLSILPAREAVPTEEALSRLSAHTRDVMAEMGGGEGTRRKVLQDLKSGLWFPAAEDYIAAMHPLEPAWTHAARVIVIDPESIAHRISVASHSVGDRWASRSLVDRPPVDPWARYATLSDLQSVTSTATSLDALAVDDAPDFGTQDNGKLFVGKGELAPVVGRIHSWLEDGWRVALVVDSKPRSERIQALLSPHGLHPTSMEPGQFAGPEQLSMWIGRLNHGFHAESARLAIISADELFGEKKRRTLPRKSLKEATLGSVNELAVGDLVGPHPSRAGALRAAEAHRLGRPRGRVCRGPLPRRRPRCTCRSPASTSSFVTGPSVSRARDSTSSAARPGRSGRPR